ncbi:MAG: FkbM family methyltransferase [Bdellovibrionales bacterium]|nr:FkbM family methyltransferase [Bdellovibrionales bacterium]
MIAIKNPHRTFEENPIAWSAIKEPSGDFLVDFTNVVSWCAINGNVDRYHRKNFGMSPEPYGIDVSSIQDTDAKTSALVRHALSVVDQYKNNLDWLYRHLADSDSKMLLLTVLAYRSLGWRYVQMPLDSKNFWDCLSDLVTLEKDGQSLDETALAGLSPYKMNKMNLRAIGDNVELYSDAFGVFNEFIYSQYYMRGRENVIRPQEGDYVIDCGACFGGTSLNFAQAVGSTGRVISYEFFPGNLKIFEENMRLNPDLAKRITVIPRPVWIKPGATMSIEGSGPATQVHVDSGKTSASTSLRSGSLKFTATSIDETVREQRLPRVDLIKMDIEGAEMMALRGGLETIIKYRPTLAISVYHKLIDFFEIPQEIDRLKLGYEFYLQHSTVHGDETVIFAHARGPSARFPGRLLLHRLNKASRRIAAPLRWIKRRM